MDPRLLAIVIAAVILGAIHATAAIICRVNTFTGATRDVTIFLDIVTAAIIGGFAATAVGFWPYVTAYFIGHLMSLYGIMWFRSRR